MKPTILRFLPKLVLIVAILAFSGISRKGAGLNAQSASIGFTNNGLIGMPDTVFSGDSVLVGAFIKNFDTCAFCNYFDTIQIHGYVDRGTAVVPFVLPAVPIQIPVVSGDSIFFILPIGFRDTAMGGSFRIGNNVIVVWPVSYDPNFTTRDSLMANVFVIDTLSSLGNELNSGGEIRCYPVPASGPLYVTSGSRSLVIKEVTVRDASGKLIIVSDNPSSGILTDSWASGIYLLEIEFENGQRSTYKIIR